MDGWDALMVSKWGRLVKYAGECVADVGRSMLDLIYFNKFMPWLEEQNEKEEVMAETAGGQA